MIRSIVLCVAVVAAAAIPLPSAEAAVERGQSMSKGMRSEFKMVASSGSCSGVPGVCTEAG